jgi:hypothetical protein
MDRKLCEKQIHFLLQQQNEGKVRKEIGDFIDKIKS